MVFLTGAWRLKTFAVIAALCAVSYSLACAFLWKLGRLGGLAQSIGAPSDPFLFGLSIAAIPVGFTALAVWAASGVMNREMHRSNLRAPLSEGRVHWITVRIVAVACILLMEGAIQILPQHYPTFVSFSHAH
ncbi:hypothetical protein [Sphingomonas sp. 3-13AW]|uniref:hypothetical protein n=1 Tax=Sphingomonas sp. 3-13AW TaxID=3050450 RepID=UPI003BB7E76C